MLSQEDIQKYYIANSNRKSITPQFNIYGCWSDTKQIIPSTVVIENKDKTNEILGHLSLGKIVHAVFRSHNTSFYDNLRLTQGQNKNITFNNVKYDYVCEFEIESDKVLTFIQNTKINTKPICIYTIYVCTKMEEVIYTKLNDKGEIEKTPAGFNDHGCSRVWGYYMNKLDAIEALHFNATDLNETCYKYACIEAYHEGISHPINSETQWFEYNRDVNGYFEIETPPLENITCCRAMG